jgi:arginase
MTGITRLRRQRHAARLIGAAIGVGGPDRGPALAPARLRAGGLSARLAARGVNVHWGEILVPPRGFPNPAIFEDFWSALALEVLASLRDRHFPVVIGGDHSCAVGTWRGVAAAYEGPVGLVWIDAHMDSHTRATSPSGNLHGMPLAHLLGEWGGPRALAPGHVCLIGIRSYEPEEEALLARLGVRVYYMDEVRARGLDAVMTEALVAATRGTRAFGVSLDIDAIDPEAAPAVNTPAAAGIAPEDLLRALGQAATMPGLAALELVEYNPLADTRGRTAELVTAALAAALPATVFSLRRADPVSGR